MPQIVTDEQGVKHSFPDEATPDMIAKALGVSRGAAPAVDPRGAAPTAGPQGMASGATDAMISGATFGLSDEVGAAGSATGRYIKDALTGTPPDWSAGYSKSLAKNRAQMESFRSEHPVAALGSELLGGIGSVFLAPGSLAAKAPLTLWKMMKGGAKAGALYGGASGFGHAEGGPENRALGAATGAALGAPVGAAFPLATKATGVGFTLLRDALGFQNPAKRAKDLILRALERDGLSPEVALSRYNKWQGEGAKPEALMDLGGRNLLRLARVTESVPGEGTERASAFLDERQAGQAERVMSDVGLNLSPVKGVYAETTRLGEARRAAAAPLYKRAYETGQSLDSPALNAILRTPAGNAALKNAVTMIRNDMGRVSTPDAELTAAMKEATKLGLMDPVAGGRVGKGLKLRTLDYIKHGFDDLLETYRDKTTQQLNLDTNGKIIEGLRSKLVSELDRLNAFYGPARAAWAGPSQSMDAMVMGRDILKEDAEIPAGIISKLSDSDKAFFRLGVVRAISDKVNAARDGADVVKRFFGSPIMRDRLQAAFPDKASFDKFEALMKREAAMYQRGQSVIGGSPTARIIADQTELASTPGFLARLMTGDIAGATGQGLAAAVRRSQGVNPGTADELSRLLFSVSPTENSRILNELMRRRAASMAQAGHRNLTREAIARGMISTTAGATGRMFNGSGQGQ